MGVKVRVKLEPWIEVRGQGASVLAKGGTSFEMVGLRLDQGEGLGFNMMGEGVSGSDIGSKSSFGFDA